MTSNGILKQGTLTFYSQFVFSTTVTGRVGNAKKKKRKERKEQNSLVPSMSKHPLPHPSPAGVHEDRLSEEVGDTESVSSLKAIKTSLRNVVG